MTEGLHRFYGSNDLYFLTFSCYRRRQFFTKSARCDLFLEVLERVRRRYRIVVLGYVVMPEHVHLLVSEPQRQTLSDAMQALKLGFVRICQCSDGNSGATPIPNPFWQARFYDFNVWTEEKRIEKLRYLHRNPVERGLVQSLEEWPSSSFRWYAFRETGQVRVNDTDILVMRIRPPAA